MNGEEHEGASIEEQLIEACRRDNVELLTELLEDKSDSEISRLLNETTTVMGNHLYHEAASRGNYEIIDHLLDQPDFECDPINRLEGDTPLHSAVRWLNAEPPAQIPFGLQLIDMMLEAGSNPRIKNKGGLTAFQLVDPRNTQLRDLIRRHEYASQNAGDFINVTTTITTSTSSSAAAAPPSAPPPGRPDGAAPPVPLGAGAESDDDDDDAEFSGSDEEERAEWERRRKNKSQR
ncbi:hypothetical protein HDV57DRAFT_518446 [Trichoderma longibrachiatum]|uniref:Uncharacterized protein n=1 Tax=Trichoderma longibrachiatum ATCC 18648 TaxID=983965 RepID=A0A2T4BRL0_TRILO|nr:hypothetical protein M440DRAFT_1442245 [Trichoderma longibrachiatum ATCC 18648]